MSFAVWHTMLLAVIGLAGVALYFMKPEERAHVLRLLREGAGAAYDAAQGGKPGDPVRVALQKKTRLAFVTPALIVLQVAIFVIMVPGSDPQALIASGASTGPRTTNGEWHRLATATFVHSGIVQLAVNVLALGAIGFIVERIAGAVAFGVAFVMAGVFASVVSLAANPIAVSFGSSGAVLGVYGVLLGFGARYFFRPSDISIPLALVKRIATAAGVFLVYNLLSGSLPATAELCGFVVGVAYGVVLSGEVHPRVRLQRMGIITAATVIVSIAIAAPRSGIDDVRSEVATLQGLERQTAEAYDVEVARYKTRPASENRLLQVIDGKILPQLRATAERLNAFDRVLPEQRQLIENARAYVRLREESWQLRADGLRQMMTLRNGGRKSLYNSSSMALRNAEVRERAALEALHGVTRAENQ